MLGPGTIMSDEELAGTSSDESEPEDVTGAAFAAAARKKSAAAAAAAAVPAVGNRFDYEELDDGFDVSVAARTAGSLPAACPSACRGVAAPAAMRC